MRTIHQHYKGKRMSLHYVNPTQGLSIALVNALNNHSLFDNGGIVGKRKGVPHPSSQKTIRWAESGQELISGEWAVPIIPARKVAFSWANPTRGPELAAIVQSFETQVREIENNDFVPEP